MASNTDKNTDKRLKNLKPAWKPGEAGGGHRPKGTTNFKTDFEAVVKEVAKLNKITISEARQALLKKAYAEARNGNFPYYRDICDRYYGKAQDDINLGGEITLKIAKQVADKYEPTPNTGQNS